MLTHLSYQLSSLLLGAKKSSFRTGYRVVAPILTDGDNVVLNVHSYKLTDESLKSLRLHSMRMLWPPRPRTDISRFFIGHCSQCVYRLST